MSFLPPATQDIRKTHDWYEKQKTGSGIEFTNTVIEQIEELQKNTIVHRFFFDDVRYVHLKKFPYSIFYRLGEDAEQLIIVAVLGNKQDQLHILKDR